MIEDFTGFQSCVDHFLGLLALFVRIILTHELSGLKGEKLQFSQRSGDDSGHESILHSIVPRSPRDLYLVQGCRYQTACIRRAACCAYPLIKM